MEEQGFKLMSPFQPTGDQPKAIDRLVEGLDRGDKEQTLMGVTGSGKTFTMANIIARVNRPTLVLAHNKTLAAQLCSEFGSFSRRTRWSILYLTTIIISQKRILLPQIPILKKIPLSMTKLTSCVIRLHRLCRSGEM